MPRIQVFACPSCGASLTVEDDETKVRCQFCGNTVIVPEELRPKPSALPATPPLPTIAYQAPPIVSYPRQPSRRGCATGVVIFVIIDLVIALIGFIAFFGLRATGADEVQVPFVAPAFANVDLTFGGKGTGQGLFQDARGIAVDDEGNVYISDYENGRVQKFDAAGNFLAGWTTEEKYVDRLAADREGNVYVIVGGTILKYNGVTGKRVGKFEAEAGDHFIDLAVLPEGGFLASWWFPDDDLVFLDAQGEELNRIGKAISGRTDNSELDMRVAVDGLGNIFALGKFNNAVFKFTPEGKFVDQFGGDGDAPGQFRAPYAIAVDGQSRVYVSDIKGIQVFDADGHYLDLIQPPDHAFVFGLAFNDQNELFAVGNNEKVMKFVLNQP